MPGDQGQARDCGGETESGSDALEVRSQRAEPFGETANPAEYVPREATERALLEMERAVRGGHAVAISAAPGLGKSLLLRLLAPRLAPDFACLFLAYGAVSLDELCGWCLGLLGLPASAEPRRGLLRSVRQRAEHGETVTLLIDDAGSMPLATARDLGQLVADSGNRLRVVLAAADDAPSSRVIAALHPEIVEVRLTEPMTARETRLYVETRLEQAGVVGEARARFHEESIGWIYRLSAGVPRRVHDLGGSLLDEAPDGVGRAWREERWLGAPLEDVDAAFLDESELGLDPGGKQAEQELPELLLDEDDPEVL